MRSDFGEARFPRKRMRRWEGLGEVRFLTFSCYRRLPLLRNDEIKQVFINRLAAVRQERPFSLLAWVVMPEHVHLLILPKREGASVGEILRSLKRPVAERVLRRWRELGTPMLSRVTDKKGVCHFWMLGGGHDHNVVSDRELDEKIDYVHNNPVRRALVPLASSYRWSSARWFATGDDPLLPCDRIGP